MPVKIILYKLKDILYQHGIADVFVFYHSKIILANRKNKKMIPGFP